MRWFKKLKSLDFYTNPDTRVQIQESTLQLVHSMVELNKTEGTFKVSDVEIEGKAVGSWKVTIEKVG